MKAYHLLLSKTRAHTFHRAGVWRNTRRRRRSLNLRTFYLCNKQFQIPLLLIVYLIKSTYMCEQTLKSKVTQNKHYNCAVFNLLIILLCCQLWCIHLSSMFIIHLLQFPFVVDFGVSLLLFHWDVHLVCNHFVSRHRNQKLSLSFEVSWDEGKHLKLRISHFWEISVPLSLLPSAACFYVAFAITNTLIGHFNLCLQEKKKYIVASEHSHRSPQINLSLVLRK